MTGMTKGYYLQALNKAGFNKNSSKYHLHFKEGKRCYDKTTDD